MSEQTRHISTREIDSAIDAVRNPANPYDPAGLTLADAVEQLRKDVTTWKTRLVNETAALRGHLDQARAELAAARQEERRTIITYLQRASLAAQGKEEWEVAAFVSLLAQEIERGNVTPASFGPTPGETEEPPAERYMMATTAHHTVGDISRDEPDLAVIYRETDTDYIGNWVAGVGFINVRFPKATTRPLTAEEIAYYRTKVVELGGMTRPVLPEPVSAATGDTPDDAEVKP